MCGPWPEMVANRHAVMMLVHSWKVQGLAAVCLCSAGFTLHHRLHTGRQPAELTLVVLEGRQCTAVRQVPTLHRQPLNQVGDIVRIRTARCMLRLLLQLVCVLITASALHLCISFHYIYFTFAGCFGVLNLRPFEVSH